MATDMKYKKVITAAVTGQIDVRDEAVRETSTEQ